jgi:hypothetical protein
VSFLSHVVSEEGMSVHSSNIRDMLTGNAPASVVDIRNLLGLLGYYQRFVKGFSKATKPMIALLGKDKKFKWMTTYEVSF